MTTVRTGAISLAAITVAAGLTACSSPPDCVGQRSIDQGEAAGQPSAHAALEALLSTQPQWLDQGGWQVGFHAAKPDKTVTFTTDGGDTVKVFRSSANGRWYLDSYRGCP